MSHDVTSPNAECIVAILRARDGIETGVHLSNGRQCSVLNIAWSQDMNDPELHVTSNISPSVPDSPIDVFATNVVVEILDPKSGHILFDAA